MKPLLLAFLLLTSATATHALEVKETRWGFDGRVVPERFNILSVRLAQPGHVPFDGEVTLRETRGGEQPVGAPLVQPLYLTPGTERWVQFTPFVATGDEWLLTWGRRPKERTKIAAASFAAPATVLLVDPASPFATETRLRAFPDELFPTTVAATDALDMVALDHVPRWEAPRREAFLDWLRRGGIVHLLRSANGYPAFEGDLAALNTTLPRERFGAGEIVRHETTRAECSAEFLKSAGFPMREMKTDSAMVLYGFDQSLLRGLAGMTRPEIAWWLIYLLTLGYLGIIGPLHYRWSKRLDYRASLAILGAAVLVFAVAFLVVGKRGSGERQMTHSMSIARALGEKRYDVTQWLSAFVTEGDTYKLTHPAPSNLYSATSDLESVNGRILNGRDGHFVVDLPLYSSRPFLHRAVMTGDDTGVQVQSWNKDGITLSTGKDFPRATEIWARWEGQFRSVKFEEGTLVIDTGGTWQSESSFFEPQHLQSLSMMQFGEQKLETTKLLRPLIARALGGVEGMQHYAPPRPLAKDHLQLFISAPAPASFSLQGKGFGRENGTVLYVQDVFRAEGT